MFEGFKNFMLRGNVVDLAVGVVIGAAFGGVVTSLVTDILTPLIGAVAQLPDFSSLAIHIGNNSIAYGNFINAILSFLMVAAAIYFAVVVPMKKFMDKVTKPSAVNTKECPECKSQINVSAHRCAFCAQPVA